MRNSPSTPVRVFLAEDSAALRARIADLLAASACEVVGEGATPDACVRAILGCHPDVVVLDVQLEGGTGLQVLKAVRAVQPRVAFVVFSNDAAGAYRKRYLAEGAVHFLDKSAEFDRLPAAVADASRAAAH